MAKSNPQFSELVLNSIKKTNNTTTQPITEGIIRIGANGKITTGIEYAQPADQDTKSTINSEILYSYYRINNINLSSGYIKLPCEYVDFNNLLQKDTLNCSGHRISIEQLLTFLHQHSEVHKLILSNCGLEINKLYKLFDNPKDLINITHLDLSSNYFVGRPVLRCDFSDLTKLQYLNLSDCEIDGLTEMRIHGNDLLQNLVGINISNNKISVSHMASLPEFLPPAEVMTKLKYLCLSHNNPLVINYYQFDLLEVEKALSTLGYNFHLFHHPNDLESKITEVATTINDWDLV